MDGKNLNGEGNLMDPIEVWTDKFADDLRNNIVSELLQKGLKGPELEEAIRHIMIAIRHWYWELHSPMVLG